MREIAEETDLPVMLGAYWDGLGGLTPEAEEPVDEEHIAAPNAATGSQKHRRRHTCKRKTTS